MCVYVCVYVCILYTYVCSSRCTAAHTVSFVAHHWDVAIYSFIDLYICIYIHIHTYGLTPFTEVCAGMWLYIHLEIYRFMYTYICIYIYIHLYVYVCL